MKKESTDQLKTGLQFKLQRERERERGGRGGGGGGTGNTYANGSYRFSHRSVR